MISRRFLITFALCWLLLDTIVCKPSIVNDGLKACKKNDPKLNECLLNILKQVKSRIIRGNPKRNLPSLDPVYIPRLTFYKNLQDFVASGELMYLMARGVSSITAKTLKVNLKKKTIDMVIIIPLITFVTDYKMNVTLKALHMPILGNGKCEGKVSHSDMRLRAKTSIKNGKLKLEDIKINLYLGDVEVKIIKSQSPTLAQTASQFFNANKRLVLDMVTPVVEDSVKGLLLRYSNNILSTVDIKNLLTD